VLEEDLVAVAAAGSREAPPAPDSDDDSLKQTIYDAMRVGFMERGDDACRQVTSVAEASADRGHYFTAGYLWMKAADTLWGNPERTVEAAGAGTHSQLPAIAGIRGIKPQILSVVSGNGDAVPIKARPTKLLK
jgi:hypothetical protein